MRGPRDALLFVRVLAAAALVPVVTRLRLPTMAALLTPRRPVPSPTHRPVDVERLVACFDAARAVGYPIVRPGCLVRGVTLYWLLSRHGLPVELRFGLDRQSDHAVGHAWLVLDGTPFLEDADPTGRFTVMFRVRAAGR